MELVVQYQTSDERETIINQHHDKFLISEKNIKEGNFLIFTDIKPIEIELSESKTRITDLELTIAEMMML